MAAVSLEEAQEKLGELIDRVARGERVEILRDGEPVATLRARRRANQRRHAEKPQSTLSN